MSLPFLPGNSFNPKLGREKYHKSHHFDIGNDVSLYVGQCKPGIGGDNLPSQKSGPNRSQIPRGEGNQGPAWVAFDRQVLNFDAFFQEAVHEKAEEKFRIRTCKIYFYLEDDTIQVIEPSIENSGVPQGTLIRRHRIPLPEPHDDKYYTVEDFNIGNEMSLYSKTFKITGCDQFTRNFLRKLGIRVPEPEMSPNDPYCTHRKDLTESMQPLRPYEKHDTLKQFLEHDRHVLRFYCWWDDTNNMFGDSREMVLHYFLADDTIEIREVIPPNSGRDSVPLFLRRGKLPKEITSLPQPGTVTDRTVLNVFGPTGHGGRYILDSLKTGALHYDFYKDSDLTIGTYMNVWGRKILLTNCDELTKEYYRTKYGITNFNPIQLKRDMPSGIDRQWPPYNGFGSEEDSLQNCISLIPKPPRRDFIKFMEKDRHGLESNILRFVAYIDTDNTINADRRFIVSYYLSDDTIAVFEPPLRNTGVMGGKFMERTRMKKPAQSCFSTQLSEYYTARDMFVGAKLLFNRFNFKLVDADEYAFRYMERREGEFDHANMCKIKPKLKSLASGRLSEVKDFFLRNDPDATGFVQYEQFSNLLHQVSNKGLSEHEIMTVGRYFSEQLDNDVMNLSILIAASQEQLRRSNFEDFNKLLESFMHHDIDRTGTVDRVHGHGVCRAFKLPLPNDLLRALIDRMEDNSSNGQISYEQFVSVINWRDNPVSTAQYTAAPMRIDGTWMGEPQADRIMKVNYKALLQELFDIAQ